jgi:hypothetical protein
LHFPNYFSVMVVTIGTLHFRLIGIEDLPLSAKLKNDLWSIDHSVRATDVYCVQFSPIVRIGESPHMLPPNEPCGGESDTCCVLGGPLFQIVVEWSPQKIIAELSPLADEIDQCFLRCMNAILSLCLVHHQGLAVHAASVHLQNRAILIAGRSGAGKSTLATRLSPPGKILDDDFSLVYRDNDRYWVTGSPFGKDGRIHSGKSASFPLEKIFFTRKAIHAESLSLSIPQAYRNLARNVFAFLALPRISSRLLENIHLLCTTIPMYIVHADPKEPDYRYVSIVFKETACSS